jgi:hypothetical protein
MRLRYAITKGLAVVVILPYAETFVPTPTATVGEEDRTGLVTIIPCSSLPSTGPNYLGSPTLHCRPLPVQPSSDLPESVS